MIIFVRFSGQHGETCSRKGGEVVRWWLGDLHAVRAGEQEGSAAGGCEPGVSRERERVGQREDQPCRIG